MDATPATAFAFSRPRPPGKPPHMPRPPRGMGGVVGVPALQSRSGDGEERAAAGTGGGGGGGGSATTLGGGGSSSEREAHSSRVSEGALVLDAGASVKLAMSTNGGTGGTKKKKRRAPTLLEYPAFEPMGVYDVDDLDPQGVFILLVAEDGSADGGPGGREEGAAAATSLFVWIGADADDELDLGDDVNAAGGRIGEECAMKHGVVGRHDVRVELEGSESAEFWEAFEAGM